MTVVSLGMAYRSFREVLAGWTPASIRRLQSNVVTQIPAQLVTAFAQGLQQFGWTDGRNVRIEYRWGAGDLDRFRRYAAELVALSPDVVLASDGSIVGAFQQASRAVPIVFVTTIDPVGGGLVESLSRPGTNATGFASFEFSMSGKWLELLKEIAPGVKRVAVIRDPSVPAG